MYCFRQIRKYLSFLDDIDRLHPKQIFELLQVLKLTCNFKNTFYIIAYDREAVELSIESQFKNYGKKYLDKIVQADFLIPEPPDEKLEAIFFNGLESLCKDQSIIYNVSSLASIWLHRGLRNYFLTLRDIYRFLNSLQFSLPLIQHEIDITDFLILEAIRLNDFESYQRIQIDLEQRNVVGYKINFESSEYLQNFKFFTTNKLIEYLVTRKHSEVNETTQEKRLLDPKFSERYFSLQISSKDISETEFKRLMEENTNRNDLLNNILRFGRIDNLIIRLNDIEIKNRFPDWDFNLIKDLFVFFDQNFQILSGSKDRIADGIINLLSIDLKKQDKFFNQFFDLLLSTEKIDFAKLYFIHFMLLSKKKDVGFSNRANEFKSFYLSRYDKIEAYYKKYIKSWENYYIEVTNSIRHPLNYDTSLFIYDYITYYIEDYKSKLPYLIRIEKNILFFLKNILFISSNDEAFGINIESLNLFLPEKNKIFFSKELKAIDITVLNDNQKQWRELALEYFKNSLPLLGISDSEFVFENQNSSEGFSEIDDHYYDKVLNLSENNYEITITPLYHIDHWRCGLKFSRNSNFPEREKRHGKDYPIFHIELNKGSSQLKVSYYDESGNQVFGEEIKIYTYKEEPLKIKIITLNEKTTVDLIDIKEESRLDFPLTIENFPWCKLFAWADNKNEFKIKANITEYNKELISEKELNDYELNA